MNLNPFLGMAFVLLVLGGAVLALARMGERAGMSGELRRKCVHMLLGVVCAALPWIFTESWPVYVLAGIAVAALAALRWLRPAGDPARRVLYCVERKSWGELCFPVAVALSWWMAADRWQYVAAILVLALADAAGALAGTTFGRMKLRTDEGVKSIEGCAAVFVVAFVCVAAPLYFGNGYELSWKLFWLALQVALLASLFELISFRGLDNLVLPPATLALIQQYGALTAGSLAMRVAVLLLLVCGGIFWRRRTRLNHAGMIGSALAFYLFWALGGWPCLAMALIGGAAYAGLCAWLEPHAKGHHFPAVVAILAVPMLWMIAMVKHDAAQQAAHGGFVVITAAQVALMCVATWSNRGWPAWRVPLVATIAGAAVCMLGLLMPGGATLWNAGALARMVGGIFAAGVVLQFFEFRKLRDNDHTGRWLLQAVLPAMPLAILFLT